MQNDAAHQLHIKMALTKGPFGGFTHQRKSIDKALIKRSACRNGGLHLSGCLAQPFITHLLEMSFSGVNGVNLAF